jgi:hypothetical protein
MIEKITIYGRQQVHKRAGAIIGRVRLEINQHKVITAENKDEGLFHADCRSVAA